MKPKSEQEWQRRVRNMEKDEQFMVWLKAYIPAYETEYSGNLLGMYDAFCAGRGQIPEYGVM